MKCDRCGLPLHIGGGTHPSAENCIKSLKATLAGATAAGQALKVERDALRARATISEADVARVATVAIHAVADVKDAQIADLVAGLQDARADFVPTALEIQRGQGLARGMEIVDDDVARVVAGADDPHTTGGKAALSLRKERDEARALLGEVVNSLAECANSPSCDDDDEPMGRDDWCQFCNVSARIAAHLGSR